ncbi:hypothetical protein HY387_01310, partial [Candidatus Daviesbacteria bacterium]|nr:hypothetical protein [Candidatus Daviesbacteria bacterium]
LTPPDTLLASGSAILSNLIVKSEATFSGMLHSYNSEISNSFKVFGDTTLGKTNIAGSLTVDGTLTIDQGSQINVLGLSNLPGSGILYLQKSAQAQGLDILSGKVTIDKTGLLTTQTISATQYRAVVGKSTGSGKISAGAKSAEIPSSVVETTSRILVTPTVETNMPLSVISKKAGQSFTVSIPTPAFQDIPFDWFIVNEASP